MFLTLSPDDNFKNSGKQRDQVDFFSTIPSGLLLKPNTNVALHSASWKVIQGITIPSGQMQITVMGHTFNISIVGQTFQEPPTGSSDTAGSLCAKYLNDTINDELRVGATNWYSGNADNSLLYPALFRFGSSEGTNHSTLWEWDNTGRDFVFEMKYNADNDFDTNSNVMVSGSNASKNFNSNAYTKVIANDFETSPGVYRYRLRPANSKLTPAWNDSGFCAFGSAFCTDGISTGGKGKYGELVFKWTDAGGSAKALVGFATKNFQATGNQTQKNIVASLEIETGVIPKFRELDPTSGFSAIITPQTPGTPPVTANGTYYRIRMESSTNGDETFQYAFSTDGSTYTEIPISTAVDKRYKSATMETDEIMPCFKPFTAYSGSALYGVDNMECTIVPSKSHFSGSGYKWGWWNYPAEVGFNPGSLSSVFDIKGFNEGNGAGKSDGGVVNNVNTTTSGVYVNLPTLGIKSITSAVERNVIGMLPIGEMSDGTNGMGSINGLQFNQVYNLIYLDMNNQDEREHNQIRVQLLDHNGNFLTNITDVSINLCVKPSSM